MDYDHHYIAGPCPGCGKPDAARMSSSRWLHNISCCSDQCGKRVGEALQVARESNEYVFFEQMKQHAESMLHKIETEEITCARMEAGGPEELPDPFSVTLSASPFV